MGKQGARSEVFLVSRLCLSHLSDHYSFAFPAFLQHSHVSHLYLYPFHPPHSPLTLSYSLYQPCTNTLLLSSIMAPLIPLSLLSFPPLSTPIQTHKPSDHLQPPYFSRPSQTLSHLIPLQPTPSYTPTYLLTVL